MINAALTLLLSLAQATRLASYCADYRAYAWRSLPPTTERNQTMKALQAVQGRLSQARATGGETLWLITDEEEKQALRHMVCILIRLKGTEAATPERNRVLGELTGTRILLERTARQTQAL